MCPGDEGDNGQDYGEGDGIWNSFDWNNNGLNDDGDVWDSNEWTPLDGSNAPGAITDSDNL